MKDKVIRLVQGDLYGPPKAQTSNVLKWGDREMLKIQIPGNRPTRRSLRTPLVQKDLYGQRRQEQSFKTWSTQTINTWRRSSISYKRIWELQQDTQHVQWKHQRQHVLIWRMIMSSSMIAAIHLWTELFGEPGGPQEHELRGNSELIQHHTEIDVGAFWRNSECVYDWKCISLMDDISIVSWQVIHWTRAKKSKCILRFRTMLGEDEWQQRCIYKMGRSSGRIQNVPFFKRIAVKRWRTIWIRVQYSHRIFVIADSSEKSRMIWERAKHRIWDIHRPLYTWRKNGILQPLKLKWWNDSKIPFLHYSKVSVLWVVESWKRRITVTPIHLNADASNTELLFRIIHSVNHSVYGIGANKSAWQRKKNRKNPFPKVYWQVWNNKRWNFWYLFQDLYLETVCGKTFRTSNHCPRQFDSQRFANSHRSGTGYQLVWAAKLDLTRTTVLGRSFHYAESTRFLE